ncbi:MAG: hypothetical protein AB9842_07950 [Bacteroidales bacterium]
MGITVTRFPSIITPSRNPAVFELATERFEGGTCAETYIQYPSAEIVGAVYQFLWKGDAIVVSLECVENPDQSGTQFPVRREETMIDWLNRVIFFLSFNEDLSRDYDMKVADAQDGIVLKAFLAGEDFTMTYNIFNCNARIYITPGANGKEKDNLKFGLQVCRRINGADTVVSQDLVTPVMAENSAIGQIDVAELLQPALFCNFTTRSYGFPAVFPRNETCLPYYIQYYEQYGEVPTIVQVLISRWFYSLNGGVPPWLQVDFFKVYSNLTQYFNTTGRFFLTWHWFPKVTDTVAPERLFMIVPRQPGTSNFLLKVTHHYYDDGDENIYHSLITTLALGQVYEIDVSYASLIGTYIENLIGYDVQVVSQDESFASDIFRFTVDVRILPHVRYFMFLNSLGGYECVRFTGEQIQELGFERDFFDRSTLTEYDENLIPRSQLPPLTTRSFKVNTGWISRETVDWMQDFLNSTEVFEIRGDNRYPVVIIQDKIELRRDSITLYSLTIGMEYADFPSVFQKEVDVPWEDVSQVEDPYQQD